jgi:two-component system invasion response regulator UvrY
MKNFLLIDDHAILRTGVKLLLTEYYNPGKIDEAQNEQEAVERIKANDYDLIFLDISMPETNALGLLNFTLTLKPASKVLIFTMNAEKIHAKRFMEAGAKGYLSKDASVDEITRVIDLLLNNKKYYSETIIDALINEKNGKQTGNPFEKLSKREYEIVNILLQGKTVTEISSLLHIHTSTAGTHKAKIFEKLNVKNLIELKDLAENTK